MGEGEGTLKGGRPDARVRGAHRAPFYGSFGLKHDLRRGYRTNKFMQMLLGSAAAVAIRPCICVGIAAGTAITPRIQPGIIHDTYAAMHLSTGDTNKFPMTILIGDFARY